VNEMPDQDKQAAKKKSGKMSDKQRHRLYVKLARRGLQNQGQGE